MIYCPTRVSEMPTSHETLTDFLVWLRKTKDLAICYRSFGEYRPERYPEKLVDEFLVHGSIRDLASQTDRRPTAPTSSEAPPTSQPGQ